MRDDGNMSQIGANSPTESRIESIGIALYLVVKVTKIKYNSVAVFSMAYRARNVNMI